MRAAQQKGASTMLGGIGMPELLVILVIVLIIFGAGKISEIGGALGRGISEFRKNSAGDERAKDAAAAAAPATDAEATPPKLVS